MKHNWLMYVAIYFFESSFLTLNTIISNLNILQYKIYIVYLVSQNIRKDWFQNNIIK